MSLSPKLLKRFFEVLVLLRKLSQVQGAKIGSPAWENEDFDRIGEVDMRRRVMDHLCRMCDFVKGGNTVTAIAAEARPSGPLYWMASNKGSGDKAFEFLTDVLRMLEERATGPIQADDSEFQQNLKSKFVQFQRRRIKVYWDDLASNVVRELDRAELTRAQLVLTDHALENEYTEWLRRFPPRSQGMADVQMLSDFAYDNRHSPYLRVGYDPVTSEPVAMENQYRQRMRHIIGRLCGPERAARLLAYAAANHGYLFQGFTVKQEMSQGTFGRPSVYPQLTLDGISTRMFLNGSETANEFRAALRAYDEKFGLMTEVLKEYAGNTWKPCAHAELTLLEALYARNCTFFNDDKYIACSKAACFCCYNYISVHPGRFVLPPSHNKVHLNWHPPTLGSDCNEERRNQQREIMNRVIGIVRLAVNERILTHQRRTKWHPDSSTGITPMPDVVDTIQAIGRSSSVASLSSNDNERQASDHTAYSRDASDAESSEDGGVPLLH